MKHNILRGATPATVMWRPVPYCDGDRELIEFVQGAIGMTSVWWPESLPHEAESVFQWYPMDSDAIARLCNYVMTVKTMIEREPIGGAFTAVIRAACSDLLHRADQRLTALLGEVLRVEDEVRNDGHDRNSEAHHNEKG